MGAGRAGANAPTPATCEVVDGLAATAARRSCSDAELLDGVSELLDAGTEYYTAVQTIIPLAATSEIIFTRVLRRLVRRAGRSARRDVPARLRQRADPGREIALRPRDVGPRRSRAGCGDCAPPGRGGAGRGAGRPGSTRPGTSGAPGSRPTSTASGTRSTTSTSSTRCRPTTRRRCWTRCGSTCAAAAPTRTRRQALAPPAARSRPRPCPPGSDPPAGRVRPAAAAGRRAPRRSARTPWPTSGWPGRCCGGCCSSWARGSVARRAVIDRSPTTCSGCSRDELPRADRPVRTPRSLPSRRAAQGAVAGPAPGHPAAAAARGHRWMDGVRGDDAGGSQEQTGDVITGIGASAGQVTAPARVLGGPQDFGRMRPGRRPGRPHHHPGLDVAVRDGLRGGHRRRRPAEPQLDRGPGVRHPRRARHRRGHPADHQRRARSASTATPAPSPCSTRSSAAPAAEAPARHRWPCGARRGRGRAGPRALAAPSPRLTLRRPLTTADLKTTIANGIPEGVAA